MSEIAEELEKPSVSVDCEEDPGTGSEYHQTNSFHWSSLSLLINQEAIKISGGYM